ncbi:MAG: polysaccharide deacetylase family protein [Armatimonadia bacterium]
MPSELGIKIDVDTLIGYRQGVPSLLRQLETVGARATFCFAVGPDRSGLAIRRVFTQRGFITKMLRNKALTTYGFPTVVYGTLLPAPLIVAADPGIARAVADAGHEICVHGWDHVNWHDNLGRMSADRVNEQMKRAFDGLTQAVGFRPRCFAAPGWQCSAASLASHDALGLAYASDVRGKGGPFRPVLGGTEFVTPQIPTNLPTLDEMWGAEVQDCSMAAARWLSLLQPEVNVLTAHAEMEGMALTEALPLFLKQAGDSGLAGVDLGTIVSHVTDFPARTVAPVRLPGRAGTVWSVLE